MTTVLHQAVWWVNFSGPYPNVCDTDVMNGITALIHGESTSAHTAAMVKFCINYKIKTSASRMLYKFFKSHCTDLPDLVNHMDVVADVLGDNMPAIIVNHVKSPRDITITSKGLGYLVSMRSRGDITDDDIIAIVRAAKLDSTMAVMLDIVRNCDIQLRKAVYLKLRDDYLCYNDLNAVQQLLDALI